MTQRRALVMDRDSAFVDFVRRSLGPYGFEVEAADGAEGLGKRLKPRPALAFIGVELPHREGFELFSRTKAIAKGLPIVLVTSSVPPSDMAMHQKLSIHADGYLDKRGLAEAQFLGAIDRLIKLGPRVSGWEGQGGPAKAAAPPRQATASESKASGSVEVVAALMRAAGLGADFPSATEPLLDQPVRAAAASAPVAQKPGAPQASPAEAKLLATIAGLERQLQAALETARGSPFSREFLDLREKVESQEREIVRLKEQASAKVARTEGEERRLRELASALLKAMEKSELAARTAQQAEQARDEVAKEAEDARAALARKTEELAAQTAALSAQHATATESLQAQLRRGEETLAREEKDRAEWAAHAEASLAAAEVRHNSELARVGERHVAELEEQRKLHAEQVKQREESAKDLATSGSQGKNELDETRAAIAKKTQELSSLRTQYAAAVESLQAEVRRGRESLARGDKERAPHSAHRPSA